MKKAKQKKLIAMAMTVLFCTSLWLLTSASLIHAKAFIAQQLLNHSWNLTLKNSGHINHKPWPWADTWPVAKLMVPQHNIKQIVLAGDSGSSLAFAPGHSLASAAPNTHGTTVISGHRDTHFHFLKDMKVGDTFYLQTTNKTVHYRIYDLQIVDSKFYTLSLNTYMQTLVLATCHPFDAISSNGSSRYLFFAVPMLLT